MKNILRITALILVTSLAWAQQTTGKISGKVTDNAGAGLAGANVIVDGTSWVEPRMQTENILS